MPLNEILDFFAKYIGKELGIIYAEHNYFQLENRLSDIAKLQGVSDIEALFKIAQQGIHGAFRQLLLDVATNNETSFFRDPNVFKAIESLILEPLKETRSFELRLWSAAASTGQEALSISMLFQEFLKKHSLKMSYQITATDISERVLQKARSGSYTQLEIQRGMPAPLLIRYFTKAENESWCAKPELMAPITYSKLNLKEALPFHQPFDLILCRNVLIYQSAESKREILNRIATHLRPGGFLIMGTGESLLGISEEFESVTSSNAILFRKKHTSLKQAA